MLSLRCSALYSYVHSLDVAIRSSERAHSEQPRIPHCRAAVYQLES